MTRNDGGTLLKMIYLELSFFFFYLTTKLNMGGMERGCREEHGSNSLISFSEYFVCFYSL